MATNLPLVTYYIRPEFNLARLTKEDEIFSLLVTLVKKNASLVNDPMMMDLLVYIASLVENLVKSSYKIDKDKLILKIYHELFPALTEAEDTTLLANLQHLKDNKIIKHIPMYKKAWYHLSGFFTHQCLN